MINVLPTPLCQFRIKQKITVFVRYVWIDEQIRCFFHVDIECVVIVSWIGGESR